MVCPLRIYRSMLKENTSQNTFYAKGKRNATQVIIQAEPCLVFVLDLKDWQSTFSAIYLFLHNLTWCFGAGWKLFILGFD